MSVRATVRAAGLAIAVGLSVLRLIWMRLISLPHNAPNTLERRARWMHLSSKQALALMGIRYRVQGALPTRGLIVANHLSYLDIAIFSAACPSFFISKKEVGGWPVFGFLGSSGGTLFVDRRSRASAALIAKEMVERFKLPIPVLVFPEGTSTDGSTVLRFHSTLFEPAVKAEAEVTAAAIRYCAAEDSSERELCWFGDAEFLPHLWRTLCAEPFEVVVSFGVPQRVMDRQSAASEAHAWVVELRDRVGGVPSLNVAARGGLSERDECMGFPPFPQKNQNADSSTLRCFAQKKGWGTVVLWNCKEEKSISTV